MTQSTPRHRSASRPAERALMLLLILAASLGVFWFFITQSGVNSNERALLGDMISGKAHRPFVTRAFVPWLTRGILEILPENAREIATRAADGDGLAAYLLKEYQAPPELALEGLVSMGWQLASLIGFAFTLLALLRRTYFTPDLFAELATMGGLAALAPMLLFGYIYDLSNLFLTSLGLYCIITRRKFWYGLVFALALFNKETALVLIVPSGLLVWDFPRPSAKKIAAVVLLQLAIFAVVRAPLNWIYRSNPGGAAEYHLLDHLDVWLNYPVIGILSVMVAGGIFWLIFHRWREKPAAAVLGVLPGLGLLVLFVLSGIPFEVRVFYEVYAAGFLCILATLTARISPLETRLPTMQAWLESLPAPLHRKADQNRQEG